MEFFINTTKLNEKMSEKEIKKSQNAVFAIVLTVIAVVIIFLYFVPVDTPEDKIEDTYFYNNFEFVKENGLWSTGIQTENDIYKLYVHYGPKELEDVKSDKVDRMLFMNKTMFLTFDPKSEQQAYIAVAAAEAGSSLYRVLGAEVHASCLQNDSACVDRYIIDCDTTNRPVLKLIISNETYVDLDDNCVTIAGNGTDLIRATDKFLYQMYGIMN